MASAPNISDTAMNVAGSRGSTRNSIPSSRRAPAAAPIQTNGDADDCESQTSTNRERMTWKRCPPSAIRVRISCVRSTTM